MSLVKRAADGILWAQAGKAAEAALAFLLSIVVIRRLGPEQYGEYGLLLGIIALGTLLTSLGFRQILGKNVPYLLAEDKMASVRYLLRWALAWRLGLTCALVLLLIPLAQFLAGLFHLPDLGPYRWALAMLFLSQNARLLLVAFFQATLEMKRVLVINLVHWSASLALVLALFAWQGVSVAAVLWASALASLLSCGVGLALAREWLFQGSGSQVPGRPLWRFGRTVWLTDFANFGLGTEADILFMGYFLTDKAQIGFYRAAVMPVQRLMGLLFSAWSGLTMPVLSAAYAAHGSEGVRRAWSSYIKLVSGLAIPLLILLIAIAEPLLTQLYSDEYLYSARLLQLYALFQVLGFAFGHGLSTEFLQTLGRERLALRLRLATAGLNVLLSILMIPRWGAAGAIVATGLAGLLMWSAETAVAARSYRLSYPIGFVAKILLVSICSGGVTRLLPAAGWAGLALASVVYTAVFASLFYLVRPLTEGDKAALLVIAPKMGSVIRHL